ncbi:MAG: alanine--tRNA ligase [Candidatus Tectimicrobiota bacterium]|nr:MAG: alanine--tRNA ligase [Candidatus Tectomicrobia bacterium]
MTGNDIRRAFLDFFAQRGHRVVKSSSLVPKDDPTLLFTNAGMVQFKDVFLGREKRDYTRAVSVQKCLRAGGKHNDLENVGRTARHHTFFEMLGNFSFGDYFKEEAIAFAWEFLTGHLKLPAERLWITIYQDDDEAFDIWHRHIGVPAERIVRMGEKDNFWSMGDTGPCGPCSEIVIDQGPELGTGPEDVLGGEGDRYLELWNLVFMQYNREADGTLTPLPQKNIDTGMGLERIAAILQGVHSNYDTDLLRPLITAVEELAEKAYGSDPRADVSMRVIADHLRAIVFLISDGVLPENTGRGYVLRRIIRRAARHGKLLGFGEPFLYRLVDVVVRVMSPAYPELESSRQFVTKVLLNEEERFQHALHQGLRELETLMAQHEADGTRLIRGEEAFRLYDTFGLPVDLAEEVAQEAGLRLDRAGFEAVLEATRQRARETWRGSGERQVAPVYLETLERVGPSTFVGYECDEAESPLLAILVGGRPVAAAAAGQEVELVFARTPFYGEAGGQVGDTGRAVAPEYGVEVEIHDTQKPLEELIVHRGVVRRGTIECGMVLRLVIDRERREAIRKNHTATHLLHAALRQILGEHVKQAGSLVAPDRLRFDFTHFTRLTERELERIERLVNEEIWANLPVQTALTTLEEAIASGALAFFGEKYGEVVRTVEVPGFSKELCGGTHVRATGEIGFFTIVHESGIGAGVRRIEALTGPGAFQHHRDDERILGEVRQLLRAQPHEEAEKLQRLLAQQRELERQLEALKMRLATAQSQDYFQRVQEVEGIKVLALVLDNVDRKALRAFVDTAKQRLGSGVVVVGSAEDGKAAMVAGVTPDLTQRISAGELVGRVAALAGGKGGGRPDMAQGGGPEAAKLAEVMAKVPQLVAELLHAGSQRP